MLKIKSKQVIDVGDWDTLVEDTYKRPYSFQQQDGCKERQTVEITIPDESYDFENDSVPEKVNGEEMSEFISKMEKLRADFNSKNNYEAKFGFIGKSQIKELEDVVIPEIFKDWHKDKEMNYTFASGFTKLMGLTLYCVEYEDYFKVG